MKKFLCVISAAALLLSAAACSSGSEGGYPVNIAGYSISSKPSSVVCLSDNVADILITCGYADAIKARSDECTQKELADVPSVGSKSNPNIQKIESVSPGVVFSDNTVSEKSLLTPYLIFKFFILLFKGLVFFLQIIYICKKAIITFHLIFKIC